MDKEAKKGNEVLITTITKSFSSNHIGLVIKLVARALNFTSLFLRSFFESIQQQQQQQSL